MTDGAKALYLFSCNKIKENEVLPIQYLSNISIDGLKIISDGINPVKNFYISNIEVGTTNQVHCVLSNVKVQQPNDSKSNNTLRQIKIIPNMPLSNGGIEMKNVNGMKQ